MNKKEKANLNTCLIISGGEYSKPDDLAEILESAEYIIACDRGYEYAKEMGITPDLIVGDFDSASTVPSGDILCEKLPTEKDDTDTMYAVRKALEKGFKDITIICAFGGRLDHSLANIQTAKYIAERGGRAILYGRDTKLIAFKDSEVNMQALKRIERQDVEYMVCENAGIRKDSSEGENAKANENGAEKESVKEYVSVFSLSEVSNGVSISGGKYELEDAVLTNAYPLGISNEFTTDSFKVSVKDGTLAVLIVREMQ